MLGLGEGSEFYREFFFFFLDKGVFVVFGFLGFFSQLSLICVPACSHQLRRLSVHTLLLFRVGVPLELVLLVTSAKGSV